MKKTHTVHDPRFWARVLTALKAGTRLIFDLGFLNYALLDQLTEPGVCLLTRTQRNTSYQVSQVLPRSATLRDPIIQWFSSTSRTSWQTCSKKC